MIWRETGPREAGPFHEHDLKICDLCGALNLATNEACFVCCWHGRFERRPDVVRMAMELMERRYGALEPSLLTDYTARCVHHPTSLGERLRGWSDRIRRWLLG